MERQDKPKPNEGKPKRSRTEEALEVVREYADDLRELINRLRRKLN
jgi:hypothetical protein